MKKHPDYELYVTEDGRVFREIKPFGSGKYLAISRIKKDGGFKKGRSHLLHRLVAETYIPNNNHFPVVNHLDFNKHNNCVENLSWCTVSENFHHYNSQKLFKPFPVVNECKFDKELEAIIDSMNIKQRVSSPVYRYKLSACELRKVRMGYDTHQALPIKS